MLKHDLKVWNVEVYSNFMEKRNALIKEVVVLDVKDDWGTLLPVEVVVRCKTLEELWQV